MLQDYVAEASESNDWCDWTAKDDGEMSCQCCVCVLLEYTHGLQDLPDAKGSNDWGDWSAKDWEMSCLCFVGCLR